MRVRTIVMAAALTVPLVSGDDTEPPRVDTLVLDTSSVDAETPMPLLRLWYSVDAAHDALRPVIVAFSGWPGTAVDMPGLVQLLARSGYVVATVEYPLRRPGDRHAPDAAALAELNRPMDLSTTTAFADSLERAEQRVGARARDAVRALAALARIDAGSAGTPLDGRIDVRRAGVLGYSLGGAVAAEACAIGAPFRAAVNVDGLHFGRAVSEGVPCPYLLISDGSPPPGPEDLVAADIERRNAARLARHEWSLLRAGVARAGGLRVIIGWAQHGDFAADSDEPSARRARDVAARYALAFFDRHVAGRAAPQLNETPPPGVAVQHLRRKGGSAAGVRYGAPKRPGIRVRARAQAAVHLKVQP